MYSCMMRCTDLSDATVLQPAASEVGTKTLHSQRQTLLLCLSDFGRTTSIGTYTCSCKADHQHPSKYSPHVYIDNSLQHCSAVCKIALVQSQPFCTILNEVLYVQGHRNSCTSLETSPASICDSSRKARRGIARLSARQECVRKHAWTGDSPLETALVKAVLVVLRPELKYIGSECDFASCPSRALHWRR